MKRTMIALASTALLTASASTVFAEPVPAGPDLKDAQHQEVVDLYERLLTYTNSTDLDLQVSGLVTADPSYFDRFRWADLIAMPGGNLVTIHRSSNATAGGAASYSAAWDTAEDWFNTPAAATYGSYTIADVLAGTADKPNVPDLTNAQSMTLYNVTATLDNQSRTYTAAFVWYVDAEGSLDYVVTDNILAGAAEMTSEYLPASYLMPELADNFDVYTQTAETDSKSPKARKSLGSDTVEDPAVTTSTRRRR